MHALKERGLGHVARLCSVEMPAPIHMSGNCCTLFPFYTLLTYFLWLIKFVFFAHKNILLIQLSWLIFVVKNKTGNVI